MFARKTIPVIVALVLAAAACGGGTVSGSADALGGDAVIEGLAVLTTVAPSEVGVDEPVVVTCAVLDSGTPVETPTTFAVTGAKEFTIDGDKVRFHVAGEFQVACSAPDKALVDETPALVKVAGGRPTSIDTLAEPATTVAGKVVEVRCVTKDPAGKVVPVSASTTVAPAESTMLSPEGPGRYKLAITAVGTYAVTCADGALKDESPASVDVVAGPAASLETRLAESTIPAGGSTGVTCEAVDAYGNPVPASGTKVEAAPELTVDGTTVSGTKAGQWEVRCVPAGGGEAKTVPATLAVTPIEASGLLLSLVPDKPAYKLGEQVKLAHALIDKYGNKVAGDAGTITAPTVTPAEGVTAIGTDQFQFDAEGEYTFAACSVELGSVCGEVTAWCDGSAPLVAIEYPERGATLDGDGTVKVRGKVDDATGHFQGLTINGAAVTVDAEGKFEFPLKAAQGINVIDAVATDTFGNSLRTLRSFVYSTKWFPMEPAAKPVPYGARAYLDDKLFYNADKTDEATFSALLLAAVANLDLNALIPSPAAQIDQLGCKYDFYVKSITFDQPPKLSIKTAWGGLRVDAEISKLVLSFSIDKLDGGGLCPDDTDGFATVETVTIGTDITVTAQADGSLTIKSGAPLVTLKKMVLTVDNWFLNVMGGVLNGLIKDLITKEFQKQISSLINGLSDQVAKLTSEPIELPLPAPLEGMNQVVLKLQLKARTAAFDSKGAAVDLDVGVGSDKLVDRTILGAVGRASCLAGTAEEFAFDIADPEKMQVAAHDDVVSELLYAYWNAGGLHIHLTGETLAAAGVDIAKYGIEGLDLVTAPLLPPVLTGCKAGEPLVAQLGDFYVETSFVMFGNPVTLHMYLFLEIPAALAVADDPEKGRVLSITVKEPTLTEIEVVYINPEQAGNEQQFIDLLKTGILPIAIDQIASKPISFALPAINLKSLFEGEEGGSLPIDLPDKDLVIFPTVLDRMLGYTCFSADLLVQDPVPVETP